MPTTTKAEERAEARGAYHAFLAVCPSRQLLDRISDKWVVLVLCALGDNVTEGEGGRRTDDAVRGSSGRCATPSSAVSSRG